MEIHLWYEFKHFPPVQHLIQQIQRIFYRWWKKMLTVLSKYNYEKKKPRNYMKNTCKDFKNVLNEMPNRWTLFKIIIS